MNLLETIRQNNNQIAGQRQGVTDETGKVAALMRARSGKQVDAPVTSSSNLGEQLAVAQSNQQMQEQVAPAAQIQNTQVETQAAGQQQQEQLQTANIAQQKRFDTKQADIKAGQILNELERGKGELDTRQYQAQMNQAAQNLRLSTQSYVDNLQREGARSRLNNEQDFRKEIAAASFGDNQELLEKKLGGQSVLDASDRQFKEAMGRMDISTAYDMFKNDMRADKERQNWAGAGALGQAGIGAYGSQQSGAMDSDYQDAKDNGYKGSYSSYSDLSDRQNAAQGPVRY